MRGHLTQQTFRIDRAIWRAFQMVSAAAGKPAAAQLRKLIFAAIKAHPKGDVLLSLAREQVAKGVEDGWASDEAAVGEITPGSD